MNVAMNVVRTVADLRGRVAAWKAEGLSVGLVPTMGALHDGHLSLVRRMGELTDRVVVSIFVNPTQFGPGEDFETYPRTFEDDCAKLATTPTALVYAPLATEMYPEGFATTVQVAGVSEGLCAGTRPHFFAGVATVVSKLLIQCGPDVAIFGEKDYQQLQVIRRMVADLNIPVAIEGGAIVREDDGLAMSSRNAYLDPRERAVAGQLNKVLAKVGAALRAGTPAEAACAEGVAAVLAAGFESVDYLEVRAARGLATITGVLAEDMAARVLVAARIGRTRLIDNMAV